MIDARTGRRRAYTLIELLIVVALLGLAGSLLVPYLVGRDSLRVQAAVRQIIGDLSFAQSDALAHQEFRRVHFFADGRGYCLLRVDETTLGTKFDDLISPEYIEDPLMTEGTEGRYIVDFAADDRYEGVRISDAEIDGMPLASGEADIVYDPLGGTIVSAGVPGLGGTIEVTAFDDVFEITISPFTGKLTVARTGG
jgi:prepilin-type N-terminal cleavage/methylation domain-containing protein